MERLDLIVIGGGTAGLLTAAGAATRGLRVALVEHHALGGGCLWTGCDPSKALIASAKLVHQMRQGERLGLVGASTAHAFRDVMARVLSRRALVAHHDDPQRFRRASGGRRTATTGGNSPVAPAPGCDAWCDG